MEHKRSGYRESGGKRIWSTTVTVVDQEQFDAGPFNFGASYVDGSLNAVIASLMAIRDLIPAEYRDSARCEVDSTSGYEGSHYPHIEVSYDRPETQEETDARERQQDAQAAAKEAQERATFEQLKRKFG